MIGSAANVERAGHCCHGDVEFGAGAPFAGQRAELARTKVGDRYVVEHMRQHGFNLGGEQSGHMVMSDFGTTGDGLVAALQVLAVMKQTERPVSDLCRVFEPVPQILENVRFNAGVPLENDDVIAAIRAGEQKLAIVAVWSSARRAQSRLSASWARAMMRRWCKMWWPRLSAHSICRCVSE